jgi:hypothetical protein
VIYIIGIIFYGVFASAKIQPWALECKTEETNENQPKESTKNC